jgi:DNA-damage-inducible protein J
MSNLDTASAVVRSRIDPKLKERSETILREMGLGMSDGIRLFLTYTVNHNALPFPVRVPNATTRAAMDEANTLAARFSSAKDLFDDLDKNSATKARKAAPKKRQNKAIR